MATVRKLPDEVTHLPSFTETHVPVQEVNEVIPQHPRTWVLAQLGITKQTLLNWEKQYGEMLTAQPIGPRKALHYSDADMDFLRQIQGAKDEARRAGIAETQREKIAQLTAGVGSRREAEELRRRLRGMELPSVAKRVAALLWHIPHLRSVTPMRRLEHYYATFYQTDSLAKLESLDAPPPSTVEREFRRQCKPKT